MSADRNELVQWLANEASPEEVLQVEAIKGQRILTQERALQYSTAQELSPEQAQTLAALKSNQEIKEAKLHTGIQWAEIEAKLRKNPEKLTVLSRLIDRGGEPTVTAKLSNGNFRFDELSKDSPHGHRDVNYDQAAQIATELGAQLMEPTVYDSFREKIDLDFNTWSWLRTSEEVRKTGLAFSGFKGYSRKRVAYGHFPSTGLRCSLEV